MPENTLRVQESGLDSVNRRNAFLIGFFFIEENELSVIVSDRGLKSLSSQPIGF